MRLMMPCSAGVRNRDKHLILHFSGEEMLRQVTWLETKH